MDVFHEAAEILKKSKYTVALTGAGVSTESGIPDFRGEDGIYDGYTQEEDLSVQMMTRNPERFYSRGFQVLMNLQGKKPNDGHKALAKLQEMGLLHEVITQNIDNLDFLAGSKDVLEVHGNSRSGHCMSCGKKVTIQEIQAKVDAGEIPPKCECGGTLRTDTVLFGDPMPEDFVRAMEAAERADTMIILGSSLRVMPVASLPRLVEHLIIINKEPTPYDQIADVVIHKGIGYSMNKILEAIDE